MKKFSDIVHMPGHKNSKGEGAPWVIKSHEGDKILSSHKTKEEAVSHLRDIEGHKGATMEFYGINSIDELLKRKTAGFLGKMLGGSLGGITPVPGDELVFAWLGDKTEDWIVNKLFGGEEQSTSDLANKVQNMSTEEQQNFMQQLRDIYKQELSSVPPVQGVSAVIGV